MFDYESVGRLKVSFKGFDSSKEATPKVKVTPLSWEKKILHLIKINSNKNVKLLAISYLFTALSNSTLFHFYVKAIHSLFYFQIYDGMAEDDKIDFLSEFLRNLPKIRSINL